MPNVGSVSIVSRVGPSGPKAQTGARNIAIYSLEGKLQIIDQIWNVSQEAVGVASFDPKPGKTTWQPVLNVGRVFFGSNEKGKRVPGFFAKEVGRDLLDTLVFEGGRAAVSDLRTISPAGPGA